MIRYCVLALALLGYSTASADDRLPSPSGESQKEAIALIRELFQDSLAKADSPSKKSELAVHLLEQALATKDDPTGRFVLLQEARRLSVAAADPDLTIRIIGELAKLYQVDQANEELLSIEELASAAKFSTQKKTLAQVAFRLAAKAVNNDELDVASKLADVAVAAAAESSERSLAEQATKLRDEVRGIASALEAVKDSLRTLESNRPQCKSESWKLLVLCTRAMAKGVTNARSWQRYDAPITRPEGVDQPDSAVRAS